MAVLNLTHATEEHLTSMINTAPSPEAAALSILTYLRKHSSNTKPKRAVATPSRALTGASLYAALAFLKKAIPSKSRSYNVTFTYVRVTCELGLMTLRTTNGEKFYMATLNAENQQNIDVLLPFSELYKLMRTLKKSTIRFVLTEESIDLYADNILSMSFGNILAVDEAYSFPTNGTHLYTEQYTVNFLKRIVPFTSIDESHPTLGCIHLAQDNTSAADGFVLSCTPASRSKDTDYFLPKHLVLDAITHIKSNVNVSWNSIERSQDKLVTLSGTLRSGARVYLSSFIEDLKFPDVQRIIPSNRNLQIRVPRLPFLDALKKAQPLAAQIVNAVCLDITDKDIHVAAETGSSNMILSTPCSNPSGDFLSIGMNVNFLIKAVESLPCDELLLSFNAATQPMVMEASDKSSEVDTLIVIMPMSL